MAPASWLASSTARCVIRAESQGQVHVKTNPRYRGKWQMGWAEWRKVGGRGDPADASEREQDYRAWRYWLLVGWYQGWTRWEHGAC